MTNVTNYSTMLNGWMAGSVSGVLCLYSSSKALRIARIIYPIFVQMQQAIGTQRYSALQMQWNTISRAHFLGIFYAISALVLGSIACTIFFRCIKDIYQTQRQQSFSPVLKMPVYMDMTNLY